MDRSMMKLSIKPVEAMPPPAAPAVSSPVEIWRDHAGSVYAYGQIVGEECWMHLPGLASFRFTADDDEVAASVTSDAEEHSVQDAYRRRVLPMALQVRGCEILHASAVCSSAGVIALCGASLVGKSTLAFGLSQRGFALWGDDVVAFETASEGIQTLSLPFEIRLRPTASAFFGAEATAAPNIIDTAEHGPGMQTEPLRSVFVLRRDEESEDKVNVRRLPFAEAFSTILGHACWFTIHDSQRKRLVINHYLDLAAKTPIYDVSFNPGFENLPAVLDAIEEHLQ
jgi:hypothetical protein